MNDVRLNIELRQNSRASKNIIYNQYVTAFSHNALTRFIA
jgi:hypothetical protein